MREVSAAPYESTRADGRRIRMTPATGTATATTQAFIGVKKYFMDGL
jgi:hypothetical protein